MPFECVYNVGIYKKDVSDDHERNMLIGQEFVLTDDVILFQYGDQEEFFIMKQPPYIATYPMDSRESIKANQEFIPYFVHEHEGQKQGSSLWCSKC